MTSFPSFVPLSPKTPSKSNNFQFSFTGSAPSTPIFSASPGQNGHTPSIPTLSPNASPTSHVPKKRFERPLSYLKDSEKARESRRAANQQRLRDRIRRKGITALGYEHSHLEYMNYMRQLEKESRNVLPTPEEAEEILEEMHNERSTPQLSSITHSLAPQAPPQAPPASFPKRYTQSMNEADLYEASMLEDIDYVAQMEDTDIDMDDDEFFNF